MFFALIFYGDFMVIVVLALIFYGDFMFFFFFFALIFYGDSTNVKCDVLKHIHKHLNH